MSVLFPLLSLEQQEELIRQWTKNNPVDGMMDIPVAAVQMMASIAMAHIQTQKAIVEIITNETIRGIVETVENSRTPWLTDPERALAEGLRQLAPRVFQEGFQQGAKMIQEVIAAQKDEIARKRDSATEAETKIALDRMINTYDGLINNIKKVLH